MLSLEPICYSPSQSIGERRRSASGTSKGPARGSMSSLSSAFSSTVRRDAALVALSLPGAAFALPWLWGLSHLFPPLNHDVGAVLQWAGRMLDGERLYIDISDVNPPLIYWLNLVPAGLAKLLHLSAPLAFTLAMLAAIAGVLALARQPFAALAQPGSIAALALPSLVLFVLLVYPQGSFGQREHLHSVLTLPYLLLAALRAQGIAVGARRAAVIGLIAAVGIAIKPYFAVLPMLIEGYLLVLCGWRARLRDPGALDHRRRRRRLCRRRLGDPSRLLHA